jgi:hypothetical protein
VTVRPVISARPRRHGTRRRRQLASTARVRHGTTVGPKFKSWRTLIYESELRAVEKSVLLAFVDFDRREEGVTVYPSNALIGWLTGWKLATVKKAIVQLRRKNLLVVKGFVRSNQLRGRIVRYVINITALPKRPSWREASGRVHPIPPLKPVRGDDVAPVMVSRGVRDDPSEATSVIDRGDVVSDRGHQVATDQYSDRTYDREDRDQEQRAARASSPTSGPTVAEIAYSALTPDALQQLERDAENEHRGMLQLMTPERSRDVVRRQVLMYLEDPRVRQTFGVLEPAK